MSGQITKIVFTSKATPVSDFEAEDWIKHTISSIESGVERIPTSNILLINMLRAELINHPLKDRVTWYYEETLVDMNKDMRSNTLWRYPHTTLLDTALITLLKGTEQ